MVKAVLFDLFGTLATGFCDPEQRIIERFNLKYDYKFVERSVCGTKFQDMNSYVLTIIHNLKLPNTIETRRTLENIFEKESILDKIKPEVPQLLRRLKTKGYQIGIISNIPNPHFDHLKRYNVKKYFDAVVYSYEVGMTKQNPEIFTVALSYLGIKPSEAVMVGDSMNSDIRPAEALGIKGILFDPDNKNLSYANRITAFSELENFL